MGVTGKRTGSCGKNHTELLGVKNTLVEINYSVDSLNSRLDMVEERISVMGDRAKKLTQNVTHRNIKR